MFHASGRWPVLHCSHLVAIHTNSAIFHNVTKVLDTALSKCTLFPLSKQLLPTQTIQNSPKVLNMLLFRFAIHQDIVQVYSYELIQHIIKHLVHQPLERSWCVRQTKRHYNILIQT